MAILQPTQPDRGYENFRYSIDLAVNAKFTIDMIDAALARLLSLEDTDDVHTLDDDDNEIEDPEDYCAYFYLEPLHFSLHFWQAEDRNNFQNLLCLDIEDHRMKNNASALATPYTQPFLEIASSLEIEPHNQQLAFTF